MKTCNPRRKGLTFTSMYPEEEEKEVAEEELGK